MSLYEFIDTTETPAQAEKPTEAMLFNGEYLEDLIPGYRTLYVQGRESLLAEVESYEVGLRDGTILQSRRFPERVLKIGYQLICPTAEAFRAAFNSLNTILNTKDAELIFDDEPDKYFVGTPIEPDDVDPGRNAIVSEFSIVCNDPFKYSKTLTIVQTTTLSEEITDESGNTSTVTSQVLVTDNTGGYKTYPTFEVDFGVDEDASGEYGSDADCGYVLFSKGGTNYSVQIGDDKEKDTSTTTETAQDFTKTAGSFSVLNTPTPPTGYQFQGTRKAETTAANGAGLKASSYGTAQSGKYYGPLVVYDIGHDLTGAFELTWKQVTACHKSTATGKKQAGSFWVFLLDSSNNIKYGYGLEKKKTSTLECEEYMITPDGKFQQASGVSLAYSGYMGFKSTSDTIGRLARNSIKRIQDSDGYWVTSFKMNVDEGSGLYYSVSADSIRKIGFFFGKYGSAEALFTNRVTYAKLVNGNYDSINSFGSEDVAIVNCGKAEIMLNNSVQNGLGDYANNWEDMYLDVGVNTIYVQYSPWVAEGYEPTISMNYRKRWL